MNNKTITFLLGAAFLLAALSLIFGSTVSNDLFSSEGIWRILGTLAFGLILSKSSVLKQRIYPSLILFCVGLIIIGYMFKIMHWPWGNLILVSALGAIPIIYSLRFLNKGTMIHLDILKVVWVNLNFVGAILTILHYPYGIEIITVSTGIFWIMFFDFIYLNYLKSTLIEK